MYIKLSRATFSQFTVAKRQRWAVVVDYESLNFITRTSLLTLVASQTAEC
jgi:hypothetical protein